MPPIAGWRSRLRNATPVAAPAYDYDFIGGLEGLLQEGERGWPALCSELGVRPLTIYYEDLVDPNTYENTVRCVLVHLKFDATQVQIPRPRTNRQSDAMNDDWVHRHEADGREDSNRPRTVP
jgi:LPS sulfotransferase NodH